MSKPLLSYFVVTYNQEAFIKEALESAFAQSYSPLEIIVSDDCSTDGTFNIAERMVAEYCGPHSVRLNRNSRNLGIAHHVNHIMELCRGELAIAAAGDDVSLPKRSEMIYQAWEQSGRRATSIFSSYTLISGDGVIQGVDGLRSVSDGSKLSQRLTGDLSEYILTRTPVVNGCTHAWSPILFKYFGPLKSDLEDSALSFRTLAIGEMFYIPEALVKYRRHDSNVSFSPAEKRFSFEHRERRLKWVDEQSAKLFEGIICDLQILHQNGKINSSEHKRLGEQANFMRSSYAVEREMMEGNMLKRFLTVASAVWRGELQSAWRSAPRLLPRRIYRALYILVRNSA
jgi:glycosyltransferase involved in cell wall biosynthesis